MKNIECPAGTAVENSTIDEANNVTPQLQQCNVTSSFCLATFSVDNKFKVLNFNSLVKLIDVEGDIIQKAHTDYNELIDLLSENFKYLLKKEFKNVFDDKKNVNKVFNIKIVGSLNFDNQY